MFKSDMIGLLLSYIYAFGLLIIIEKTGQRLRWPQWLTRKLVHIGAGMWIWGILALFEHWYFGIIPFATFIVLNYLFYRRETFKAMDKSESTPGTVYFAASITVLFVLLWRNEGPVDHAPIAVAAVMAMTWGDALASLIGIKWGKNKYRLWNQEKSWQGSAAMFSASFVVIALTLILLPASVLSPFSAPIGKEQALCAAFFSALIATFAEALSPAGTDNLSAPLVTAVFLWVVV